MTSPENLRKLGFKKEQEVAPSGRVGEFNCNGYCDYYYDSGSIKHYIYDDDNVREEFNISKNVSEVVEVMIKAMFTKSVYDIYPGMSFMEEVKEGYINKNDGSVANIFVDGYISNIGFRLSNYSCGDFMLSEKDWKAFCFKHNVLINFAHK